MYKSQLELNVISLKEQSPDEVVDIKDFIKDEEVYSEGARQKASFVMPEGIDAKYKFCLPSWRYMFKQSRSGFPIQFLIEVFAYQLGSLIGIPVPPAFVSIDGNTHVYGALIEWFYDDRQDVFFPGGNFMHLFIENFEHRRGREHNFQTFLAILKSFNTNIDLVLKCWAKVVIFDAIIGNTDRHQSNWGLIIKKGKTADPSPKTFELSPAYDNGTSMGYVLSEKDLLKYSDLKELDKYISSGRPHMKWTLEENWNQRLSHEDFITQMITSYPFVRDDMLSSLQFSDLQVKNILDQFDKFNISVKISEARSAFMMNLVTRRKERLLSIIGGK